jgi:hypothetical protein
MSEASPVLSIVLPLVLWCIWWLLAVNWQKAWPMLAAGGWAPVVLLILTISMSWAAIAPAECNCLGPTVGNGWWQLFVVVGLALLALFCGWLQGQFGWTPREIDLEPPAPAPAEHGHAHH